MLTPIALAQSPGTATAQAFVATFNDVILFPIILLLTAVALLVFMYGCFLYIVNAANPSAREDGRKHILWGIVGLFIMLAAFAILSIAANTFGLSDELDCADNPNQSKCNDSFRLP